MKFYIASRLENAKTVKEVANVLTACGHEHTYDWTVHGSVKGEGCRRLPEVAYKELQGVIDADMVIVILPGGRGTHTEFGAALATNKYIFLCADDDTAFQTDERTCSFYWHGAVRPIIGDTDKWISKILRTAKYIDSKFPRAE